MFNKSKSKKFLSYLFFFCAVLFNNIAHCAMHDPTAPPGMGYLLENSLNPSNIYNLHIDGIFIGKNKKNAIINGQRVSIGDKIFNIDVIDIYNNSVRFKDENGEFVIPMVTGVTKSPINNTTRNN